MHSFAKELKKYQKGIIAGLIIGFVAANYVKQKGIDLLFAVQSQGLLDRMASTTDPTTLAFYKVALVFMVVFAIIGYFIEKKLVR